MQCPAPARLLPVVALWTLPALPAQWAAEWHLDETTGTKAADSSGNGNDGTLVNFSTTPNPWGAGRVMNALTFDGVDDHITVSASSSVPAFDGKGTPYSVCYWVKAPRQSVTRTYAEGNSNGGANTGALFTFGSGLAPNDDDKFQFLLRNDALDNKCRVYSTAPVYDDTWHHVAFVDVSGAVSIYVDGALDSTHTYIQGKEPGSVGWGTFTFDRIGIGALIRAAPTNFHRGALDDVRIYDFALSKADIALVMLGVPRIPCSASVGYYGHPCAGTLDVVATGNATLGGTMTLQLTGGTPAAAALLLVGAGLDTLDLSLAGFPGCVAYASLNASILVGIGALDGAGSSPSIPVMLPSQPALSCVLGVIQGVAISGSNLALSRAALAHLGK